MKSHYLEADHLRAADAILLNKTGEKSMKPNQSWVDFHSVFTASNQGKHK